MGENFLQKIFKKVKTIAFSSQLSVLAQGLHNKTWNRELIG